MAAIDPVIERRSRYAVEVLSRYAPVAAAYLFGSRVEGSANEWSDIDLAAFLEGIESWDVTTRAHTAALVQKEAGDDIELHFFPARSLHQPEPASFAAYILGHGVAITP
ncbi:Nucleotidyltransferase domain protein [Candidatus Methylomirabilis lanthanidiphila]|uniref:Nucleotidyltransferase domain protein n=1 Tax=Candidatus Methylomirabilis lanthanidiphila TaxID=2211376 RepID=A0A564ZKH4_9BACT|nr:nucleotidyltransferase domain-containing protein [Candidatus Methylomirabilis lanthanidiphila]VUZ85142.1 Nucleotidyltransferase domain protein [Candidatus Methylomirabilis lanthanidiphila]